MPQTPSNPCVGLLLQVGLNRLPHRGLREIGRQSGHVYEIDSATRFACIAHRAHQTVSKRAGYHSRTKEWDVSYRGGALHGHQKFQHSRFVESDSANYEIDLLMFKNSKGVSGRVNGNQIADIAQHRLKHLRSVRLRGD